MAGFWKTFYIENVRFDLGTLSGPSRSPPKFPNPMLCLDSPKIFGGPGPPFPADLEGFGSPGRFKTYIYILLTASKSQPGVATAMKRLLAEVVDVSDDEDEPARQLPYMIVLGKFGSFVNASTSVT